MSIIRASALIQPSAFEDNRFVRVGQMGMAPPRSATAPESAPSKERTVQVRALRANVRVFEPKRWTSGEPQASATIDTLQRLSRESPDAHKR